MGDGARTSLARPHAEAATTDFYLAWVPDGFKADLIDGDIVMASPASSRHEQIQTWLSAVITMYVGAKDLGNVFGSRMTFELDEYNAFEPDIAFLTKEHADRIGERKIVGPPDVAVEIVSPSTRSYDYGAKRDGYERAGTSEYWLVDYLQARVEFLRLVEGRYQLVPLESGSVFRSAVIDGFSLDVNTLLTTPLASAFEVLQALLRA